MTESRANAPLGAKKTHDLHLQLENPFKFSTLTDDTFDTTGTFEQSHGEYRIGGVLDAHRLNSLIDKNVIVRKGNERWD